MLFLLARSALTIEFDKLGSQTRLGSSNMMGSPAVIVGFVLCVDLYATARVN